jgi:hypothetical protein
MRINYKGKFEDKARNEHRLAEISFSEKEETEYERMAQVLNIHGWDLQLVADGYAMCEVTDHEEYKSFAKDYKEVKRSVALWKKFGI